MSSKGPKTGTSGNQLPVEGGFEGGMGTAPTVGTKQPQLIGSTDSPGSSANSMNLDDLNIADDALYGATGMTFGEARAARTDAIKSAEAEVAAAQVAEGAQIVGGIVNTRKSNPGRAQTLIARGLSDQKSLLTLIRK